MDKHDEMELEASKALEVLRTKFPDASIVVAVAAPDGAGMRLLVLPHHHCPTCFLREVAECVIVEGEVVAQGTKH